ncbi:MAG TPA: PQQ-dependent sugar dehydrogenase [Saprospiraceae bacterium]|nr:PQQ-dependent sugar dehydrogenase [Saprospiraceae bacterium]
MFYLKFFIFIWFFSFLSSKGCDGDSLVEEKETESYEQPPYIVDTLLTGLSNPWGLVFLPDESFLFTERSGRLYYMESVNASPVAIQGVPQVASVGQGGLMDVQIHPNFESEPWVYITYSVSLPGGYTTRLGRGYWEENHFSRFEVLFTAQPVLNTSVHFGSRIIFDDKGHVYCGIGDRGRPQLAQDISNHMGTVVRMKLDGSPADDNPFTGNPVAAPHIYAYGIRNPQGMAVHPETKEIWLHEHGPKGGDEVNLIKPGLNYGWAVVSHGVNYNGTAVGSGQSSGPGFADPLHYWTPSIAPCGMDFYTGGIFPDWKNSIFIGALAGQHISQLIFNGYELVSEKRHLQGFARFRAVTSGPDGFLYFLTESPGLLCRIKPDL